MLVNNSARLPINLLSTTKSYKSSYIYLLSYTSSSQLLVKDIHIILIKIFFYELMIIYSSA